MRVARCRVLSSPVYQTDGLINSPWCSEGGREVCSGAELSQPWGPTALVEELEGMVLGNL